MGSITLPSAGTYLLTMKIGATISSIIGPQNGSIYAFLSTAPVAGNTVPNTSSLVQYTPGIATTSYNTSTTLKVVTITGAITYYLGGVWNDSQVELHLLLWVTAY